MITKITRYLALVPIMWIGACLPAPPESSPAAAPPNIVLIMGDDMGFSDLGCYGGEIRTPNLDRLAARGLRFTHFYNTGRCCPTRASLLTGLYPQQAGIGHMVNDRGTEAYRGDLSERAVTIAEVLKGAGYATYMSGKWHVTPYVVENPDKKNWPRQRGFDQFFGMITGAGSLYDPPSLTLDNEYVPPRPGFYCTTDFTDYAVKCIEDHRGDQPFFLYLSYTAAHWPMHAPAEAVARYRGQYEGGWDAVRAARFRRMQEMGLIEPDWKLPPRDSLVPAWTADLPDRDWEMANMEVYAAMVELMDAGIGRVVSSLEAKGQLDNTLILFLQDNGACAEELGWLSRNRPEAIPEPMAPDALQTQTVPTVTRDGKPVRLMKEAMPGPPESYTAYGRNWANASNTPFREYKHWVHEGGIATPLIAHWPAGIKARGETRNEPSHLIDIMATCVDVSGAVYPDRFNEQSILPMEGESLVPVFADTPLHREAIYWEHEGNRAVRSGRWKLVSKAHQRPIFWDKIDELALENWELYNMETDRTELQDLSEHYPDRVRQMADLWMRWGKRTGTLPRPAN